MRGRFTAAVGCLLLALPLLLAACGGDNGGTSADDTAGDTGSDALTIYSSLPMQGESRGQSLSILNGEKMALAEAGSRVGGYTIKIVAIDDSTSAGKWDPSATSSNARKAAQDRSTIAYLGDFDSGASAISIPILNEAGILQISPSNTAVGLTRAEGADKGEPDKYYPSGKRNYGRVIPNDRIQAAAQVMYQKDLGCTKTYVLNDKEVDGTSLADQVVPLATRQGLEVVGNDGIDPKAANYRALAQTIRTKAADCVFFSGSTQNNAVQLWKDIHAADPTIKLFGSARVAESAFAAKIGPSAEKVTYITSPALDPKLYPPSGRKFLRDYRASYHADPEPFAIFGYEAMKVALQAIRDAGAKGNNRNAVMQAFFKIRNRNSVLGPYSIDANGDTTLSVFGGSRVQDGKLVFDRVFQVPPSS